MSKEKREWEEVAHPGFVAIFTASNIFNKRVDSVPVDSKRVF